MRNRHQFASVIKSSEYAFVAAESFEPESGSIINPTTYTKYDNVHLVLITKECESDSLRCFQQLFSLTVHVQKIPIKWEDAVQLIVNNKAVGALCCCEKEGAIFTIEELCALRNIPVPKNAAQPKTQATTPQATTPQTTQSTEQTPPTPATTPNATGKVENAFKNNAALLNRLNQNASKNANASSNKVASAFNNSSFLKNMNPGTSDTKE